MKKNSTLNLRVNPEDKQKAEIVLAKLGIPMTTAITMYLKQIHMTGGIPFNLNVNQNLQELNMDLMTDDEIIAFYEERLSQAKAGKIQRSPEALAKLKNLQ